MLREMVTQIWSAPSVLGSSAGAHDRFSPIRAFCQGQVMKTVLICDILAMISLLKELDVTSCHTEMEWLC